MIIFIIIHILLLIAIILVKEIKIIEILCKSKLNIKNINFDRFNNNRSKIIFLLIIYLLLILIIVTTGKKNDKFIKINFNIENLKYININNHIIDNFFKNDLEFEDIYGNILKLQKIIKYNNMIHIFYPNYLIIENYLYNTFNEKFEILNLENIKLNNKNQKINFFYQITKKIDKSKNKKIILFNLKCNDNVNMIKDYYKNNSLNVKIIFFNSYHNLISSNLLDTYYIKNINYKQFKELYINLLFDNNHTNNNLTLINTSDYFVQILDCNLKQLIIFNNLYLNSSNKSDLTNKYLKSKIYSIYKKLKDELLNNLNNNEKKLINKMKSRLIKPKSIRISKNNKWIKLIKNKKLGIFINSKIYFYNKTIKLIILNNI